MSTPKITVENVTEESVHNFTVMASDLRLPVSMASWPRKLETDLGNGQPFVQVYSGNHKVTYRQDLGCLFLHIYNS